MAQKVSAEEIRNQEIMRQQRAGTYGMEQCPGCPPGVLFWPNEAEMIDGCSSHSTATYYATSRDAQMGGGNL